MNFSADWVWGLGAPIHAQSNDDLLRTVERHAEEVQQWYLSRRAGDAADSGGQEHVPCRDNTLSP